jgi:hypothetical protein
MQILCDFQRISSHNHFFKLSKITILSKFAYFNPIFRAKYDNNQKKIYGLFISELWRTFWKSLILDSDRFVFDQSESRIKRKF